MLLSITQFLGRFHPVIVHLPIGILLIALLLQWLSRKEQYTLSYGVMRVLWAAGILSALLACITGYLLSVSGEYEENTVALHMWMGIGVAAVSLLVGSKVFARQFDTTYKASSLALLLLIIGTGHFGGSLTHGEDYLSSALKDEADEEPVVMKPIANVQEANVYADVVQPLLEARCYSCHGPKKQKGKLRMDSPAFLLKGGEDGEIFKPGQPDESELIKRLLLPVDDKEHMPPKQKPQLTDKQVALLHWWIEQGASFDKKIKDLNQPDKVKPVLASLQNGEQKIVHTPIIPESKVEPASAEVIDALRKKEVVVMPVAQNSNYLMANFVSANNLATEDIKLLLSLKKQLLWLKINNTKIGDDDLAIIGQCVNLRLLQLSNTSISDKGLANLKSLVALESLNLVGTNVTTAGVMQLKDLHKLKSLFLYQTKVNRGDYQKLKSIYPRVALDTGGYVVPTLVSDTTQVKPKTEQ